MVLLFLEEVEEGKREQGLSEGPVVGLKLSVLFLCRGGKEGLLFVIAFLGGDGLAVCFGTCG